MLTFGKSTWNSRIASQTGCRPHPLGGGFPRSPLPFETWEEGCRAVAGNGRCVLPDAMIPGPRRAANAMRAWRGDALKCIRWAGLLIGQHSASRCWAGPAPRGCGWCAKCQKMTPTDVGGPTSVRKSQTYPPRVIPGFMPGIQGAAGAGGSNLGCAGEPYSSSAPARRLGRIGLLRKRGLLLCSPSASRRGTAGLLRKRAAARTRSGEVSPEAPSCLTRRKRNAALWRATGVTTFQMQ